MSRNQLTQAQEWFLSNMGEICFPGLISVKNHIGISLMGIRHAE